jgi:hypothetical protein
MMMPLFPTSKSTNSFLKANQAVANRLFNNVDANDSNAVRATFLELVAQEWSYFDEVRFCRTFILVSAGRRARPQVTVLLLSSISRASTAFCRVVAM